tara:strand:+ start:16274 stop:17332 length:1059 start_codon:yes stop_codon:yes gene_type:complete
MKKNIIILSTLFLTNCYKFKSNDLYCKNWGQVKESHLKKRDLKILKSNPKDLYYPKDKSVVMMMTKSNIFDFDLATFREYCKSNKFSVPFWLVKQKSRYEDLKHELQVLKNKLPILDLKLKEARKILPKTKESVDSKLKEYESIKEKHKRLFTSLIEVRQKSVNIKSKFNLENKLCEVVYTRGSSYNTQSKTLGGFGLPLPRGKCMKQRIMINGGAFIYVAGINENEIGYGTGPYRVFEMPHDIIKAYYATPNYNGIYYIFYRNKESMIKILFGSKVYNNFKNQLDSLSRKEKKLVKKIKPFSELKLGLLNARENLEKVYKNISDIEVEIYSTKSKIKNTETLISKIERVKR